MGRQCPLGGYVLYLDCLECEQKICRRDNKMNGVSRREQYWKAIDAIMEKRGYRLGMITNKGKPEEVRSYTKKELILPAYIVEIRKGKEFKLWYAHMSMFGRLETPWCSSLDDDDRFEKLVNLFLRAVNALEREYEQQDSNWD